MLRAVVSAVVATLLGVSGAAVAASDGGLPDLASTADLASAPRADLAPAAPVLLPVPVVVPPGEEFPVRIGDRRVFVLRAERAGQSADARARKVAQVLEQLLESGKVEEVRVERQGELRVVYSGKTPLLQLGPEDAKAAGDASLDVHADAIASAIRRALDNEIRRRATANLVFSFSLVVLSGLIAFLLLRGVSRIATNIATSVDSDKRKLGGFRIGSVELLTPAAVKVVAQMGISVVRPILQITLVYFWVVFALSLFPQTLALGQRVSGFVLAPLTTLVGRVGATLPVAALLAIGAFAVAMVLRFVKVFFEGVERGELHFGWLPADLAMPLGVLVRIAVIVAALLGIAPLVTGSDNGTLPIAGIGLLAALVLAATPALAGGAVGALLLLGRRLKIGDFVEVGVSQGVLRRVDFFELILEDKAGNELRVPHLLTLVRPLRVLGDSPASRWEVTIDPKLPQGKVRKTLADAVRRQGHKVSVELVEIDAQTARYIIVGHAQPGEDDLASAIADALTREGLAFGRIRKVEA